MEQEYTQDQIDKAKAEIAEMDHEQMCRIWRFQPEGTEIYLRKDLGTGDLFANRLFGHFGGFTPLISKRIGWRA